MLRERIADTGLPVAYCKPWSAGRMKRFSTAAPSPSTADGTLAWQGAMFAEALSLLHFADGCWQERSVPAERPVEADVYQALVLGCATIWARTASRAR